MRLVALGSGDYAIYSSVCPEPGPWNWCLSVCVCSVVSLSSTPWAVAHQAPLSMEFSRQEYWSRLPFSSRGDIRHPGIKLLSPASPAGGFFITVPPGKPWNCLLILVKRMSQCSESPSLWQN